MPSRHIELEEDRWPVGVVRPRAQVEDPELDAFLVEFREVVQRHEGEYALVLDLRFNKDMPATQRKRISEEIEHGETNERCAGTAFVFASSVMRLILTAILWLARPKQELKVFEDYHAAIGWAADKASSARGERRAV